MATRRGRVLFGASLLLAACPGNGQPTVSTLEKIARSDQISLGIRDRSLPFGYTNGEGTLGYAIDVCMHVVAAVKRALGQPDLGVAMRPVMSVCIELHQGPKQADRILPGRSQSYRIP